MEMLPWPSLRNEALRSAGAVVMRTRSQALARVTHSTWTSRLVTTCWPLIQGGDVPVRPLCPKQCPDGRLGQTTSKLDSESR